MTDGGPPIIAIAGFMAAGKTTVARALARRLGRAWADLDEAVTKREGRTPARLIEEDGEAAFRDAETRALSDLLERGEASVIALGGGTFALARNRVLLAAHGCVSVWLDAPFDLCWRRITEAGAAPRPLARDRAAARRLYDERLASYRLASLRVRVSAASSPEATAAEVAGAVGA
ncbi:MAG TPA: shikimate kinase [Pyrinomonadaceae bacterium]|nr:shikimate kinase [Pyrinomonadaceae bacterium]